MMHVSPAKALGVGGKAKIGFAIVRYFSDLIRPDKLLTGNTITEPALQKVCYLIF